jgi:hypothetical protein
LRQIKSVTLEYLSSLKFDDPSIKFYYLKEHLLKNKIQINYKGLKSSIISKGKKDSDIIGNKFKLLQKG